MPIARYEDIDNDLLIPEVEMRPALYDKTLKEYADANLKRKLWEEVCMKVFHTIWIQLSKEQKAQAGALVQRRWKNLRTCFTRELRDQMSVKSEQSAKKRRKYKYYEELLFLLPSLQGCETSENAEEVVSDEERKEIEEFRRTLTLPPNKKKKKIYEENLQDIPIEKKETSSDIDDPDKHFALSLVPMLKALSPNDKLDVQIRILQVFQNIHNQSPHKQSVHSNRPHYSVSSNTIQKHTNLTTSPDDFSGDGAYSTSSNPTVLRVLTSSSVSASRSTSLHNMHTNLASPEDSNSIQSYESNFSVTSDHSETMGDVTAYDSS